MHVLIFLCLYHYCLRQESSKFKLLCIILYAHSSVIRWLLIHGFDDNKQNYLPTISHYPFRDIC